MKIIFFKKQNGKANPLTKILISICLLCSGFLSFILLNQPVHRWEEAGEWQIKVYQKADHMMTPTPPWLMINELNMSLTRESGQGEAPWCLEVKDSMGNELFPGVSRLKIYYSEDLRIINGYALNETDGEVMSIEDFCRLSLYGPEFFSPQIKRYQDLLLLMRDKVKVDLSGEKERNVWWEKDHPWWVIYESNQPPLKAELQED